MLAHNFTVRSIAKPKGSYESYRKNSTINVVYLLLYWFDEYFNLWFSAAEHICDLVCNFGYFNSRFFSISFFFNFYSIPRILIPIPRIPTLIPRFPPRFPAYPHDYPHSNHSPHSIPLYPIPGFTDSPDIYRYLHILYWYIQIFL